MRIAVSATGPSLDAAVDPRFGRCPYFVFVETDDMSFEAAENSSVTLSGGAGIQSAQWMADQGVQYVLTGNCGPNAYRTLEAAGIQVVIGCSGTVRQAVESFKSGTPTPVQQPNVASHFGMGMGRGTGRSMGSGMGRGMGMGRGLGRASTAPESSSDALPEEELSALKQEADSLGQHLKQIQDRISELERKGKTEGQGPDRTGGSG